MNTPQYVHDLFSRLSKNDQVRLLSKLMAQNGLGPSIQNKIRPAELAIAEKWFSDAVEKAITPKTRNSRLRLWFIFMLSRYGGLRLEEIFDLTPPDLEFHICRINIGRGKAPRQLPLPPLPSREMRRMCGEWPYFISQKYPFRCDGSLVRRAFSQCSERCGISPGLLTGRALRKHRGFELENMGLAPNLVNLFLGRNITDISFDAENGRKILEQTIQNEQFPKTSARNAFRGRLVKLTKRGILVETCLETSSGLLVHATITDTSRQNLGLKEGGSVTALIKAPLVNVFEKEITPPPANHFYGKIKEIKQDEHASEVIVLLPQGNIVCALLLQKPAFSLFSGKDLGVSFSPLSVILTSG